MRFPWFCFEIFSSKKRRIHRNFWTNIEKMRPKRSILEEQRLEKFAPISIFHALKFKLRSEHVLMNERVVFILFSHCKSKL